ncbi:MAG TPA: hypothetical protein PKK69_02310, partial [Ferruginibacter sp.]|nr:hypothetical protein [Ferruginibacter sp.]
MKSWTSTLRALSLVLLLLHAFLADANPVSDPGALPPPAISPAGPVTFCGRGTLTVGGYTGNPNFLWLNNNSPIPASNQPTHVVTTSGNYACVLIYNNHNDTTTAG